VRQVLTDIGRTASIYSWARFQKAAGPPHLHQNHLVTCYWCTSLAPCQDGWRTSRVEPRIPDLQKHHVVPWAPGLRTTKSLTSRWEKPSHKPTVRSPKYLPSVHRQVPLATQNTTSALRPTLGSRKTDTPIWGWHCATLNASPILWWLLKTAARNTMCCLLSYPRVAPKHKSALTKRAAVSTHRPSVWD
jgi:hypothetical protein